MCKDLEIASNRVANQEEPVDGSDDTRMKGDGPLQSPECGALRATLMLMQKALASAVDRHCRVFAAQPPTRAG